MASEQLSGDAANQATSGAFFGDGVFDWQLASKDREATWRERAYDEERWWGAFPKGPAPAGDMFERYPWAVGPFGKYEGNPIIGPTPGAWDQGHGAGAVHNGSILLKDGKFHYLYRGEGPIDRAHLERHLTTSATSAWP